LQYLKNERKIVKFSRLFSSLSSLQSFPFHVKLKLDQIDKFGVIGCFFDQWQVPAREILFYFSEAVGDLWAKICDRISTVCTTVTSCHQMKDTSGY
jgi:hypothetical protein